MALVDRIAEGAKLAIDTHALIYLVEENPAYLPTIQPVFDLFDSGYAQAHVSVISLLEVLVLPLRQERPDLVERYKEILMDRDLLTLHDLTTSLAEIAADIRANARVEVSDSIVAATAFEAECDYLITNNADDFKEISDLKLLVINEHLA